MTSGPPPPAGVEPGAPSRRGDGPWPNLFVVGAQKAGTTAVHHVLARHPEILMSPVKEPCHFVATDPGGARPGRGEPLRVQWESFRSEEMYLRLFATVDDRRWRGESTTLYLYDSKAATAIRRRCPDARIVAIVREPVDRAFSAWSFARRRGWEREADFRRALDAEAERVRAGWGALWHYRRQGMYAGQIARYLDVFGPDRVFVRSFDLLRADPHRFFRELLVFLGLDWPPGFTVTLERNVGSLPRVSLLSRLLYLRTRVPPETRLRLRASALGRAVGAGLTLIERVNGSRTTRLPPAIAHDLQAAFADDIRATARLTGQPLAEWLGRYAGESETRSESSPAAGR